MACVFASMAVYWNLVVSCDVWRIQTVYCGVFSSLFFFFFFLKGRWRGGGVGVGGRVLNFTMCTFYISASSFICLSVYMFMYN